MRTLLIAVSAGVLAAGVVAAAVSPAALRWPATVARAEPVVQARAMSPVLRRLAPTDKVEFSQLRRQLEHLTEGNVVLDMRALESFDAARTLVLQWRNNHPVDAHLVCWFAPADDDPGLASAVRALSGLGCSALHVALANEPSTQLGRPADSAAVEQDQHAGRRTHQAVAHHDDDRFVEAAPVLLVEPGSH